jgi:tetratricopeptide (TPR) repeat protein
MKLTGSRSTGKLVGILIAVVIIGILIARSYYGSMNRSVDPRIIPARELYATYDRVAGTGNYYEIFELLDTIEDLYRSIAHYESSYEVGVLDNNRAAALLTVTFHGEHIPAGLNPWAGWPVDSIVQLAELHANKAIITYEAWNAIYSGRTRPQIREMIEPLFLEGLDDVDEKWKSKYLESRAREIEQAVLENERRLSVCYTNLGLVYRHRGQYKEALQQYEKALALWDRNLDAENNMNKLLGRPVKKRNILQKLFPPDR